MPIPFDKLIHFIVGASISWVYWHFLERYAKTGIRHLNPFIFLIGTIWSASGLFFFRLLFHLLPASSLGSLLNSQWFYMAIPDWDIPLYQMTRFSFLLHRSWLFHSVLLPIGLLLVSFLGMQQKKIFTLSSWLRDAALSLCIGISAHLIWDALLSETKKGFFIHGWSHSNSLIWLFANLAIGFSLPFILLRLLPDPEQLRL